ncbi:MAG: iron-containing alcohol dehydrogenase [Aigarchaeota archaeon]|nr:iron-containing alcohol dehydrogenase [Aigarchaeota archaeon]MCX8192985.1 iron-containing alcohol dehydrogenase [Nitrososphaeria archaeon]MDW7986279.1 iron-containing alcohol dehydrogenase [Nitrososphaerota archaeon]
MSWKSKLNINRVFTITYGGTKLFFGVGGIRYISNIFSELKNKDIDRVLLITGRSSYKISGAWDYVKNSLEEHGFDYQIYDRVLSNPTVDMVDEAVNIGREFNVKAIIGIGGGSPIDTAKAVGCLLAVDGNARELFMKREQPGNSLPVIAINLTHGTGTEINRYGVETIPEKKYKIGMSLTYPQYSIDDPQLLVKLDKWQTIATAIDSLNHATEAATKTTNTPFSIHLSREAAHLVFKYLPIALIEPENLLARYYLLYASMLSGIAIDHVGTHLTHSMEHPLSGFNPEVPHGVGLGILLPSILKLIYPAVPEILTELYEPIAPNLKANPGEAYELAVKVEEWMFNIGLRKKLSDYGFTENDIPELLRLFRETPGLRSGLEATPVAVDEDVISMIYRESLYPITKR